MKKITLLAFMLLFVLFIQAQEKLTVSFNDSSLKEVINTLEDKTHHSFFYMENWLDENKITKTYTNATLETILDDLLKERSINYTVFEGKVIFW